MRALNYFNLAIVLAASLFTYQSVWASTGLKRVHLMQNVSGEEAKEINDSLKKLGYIPTESAVFSESHDAIIITKALKNEHESASLTIELVHLENEKEIPRTLFQYRLGGNDVHSMMKAFPRPEAFSEPTMPVAQIESR